MHFLFLLFLRPLYSQSAEQLMLFDSNSKLVQEAQRRLGNQTTERKQVEIGVPTSKGTQILNTDDAISDSELLLQSTAPDNLNKTAPGALEDSVVQRYYGILSGEVLPIYGVQEFAQSQDQQLLFFNTMGKNYRLAAGDVVRVTLRVSRKVMIAIR